MFSYSPRKKYILLAAQKSGKEKKESQRAMQWHRGLTKAKCDWYNGYEDLPEEEMICKYDEINANDMMNFLIIVASVATLFERVILDDVVLLWSRTNI